MQRSVTKFIALPMLLIVMTGCQSNDFNHYTAPEVTGRVLAADTHQPIANVRVRRDEANNNFKPFGPPKGGELLMRPAPTLTDADGRFVLDSTSVLSFFRHPGWWTGPVSYQHSGYHTLHINYTASNVVNHATSGPPVVDAGDVLLEPVVK